MAINCIFLTVTSETGLLRIVSQDDSIPFTTPANYYSSLARHHSLHTSYYNLSTLAFSLCHTQLFNSHIIPPTPPCIVCTKSEVFIYIDATMHIYDTSSCNGFDHSNHSNFWKNYRDNKVLQNKLRGLPGSLLHGYHGFFSVR